MSVVSGNKEGASMRSMSPLLVPLQACRRFLSSPLFFFGAVSAVVTFCLFILQALLRGHYPFGSSSFLIGDEYSQFLPMAAEYRRILLGTTDMSSYNWTWTVAGGVPMNGNIATYDGGFIFPFVLLLLPEAHVELALFLVTGLSYAVAAWTMMVSLRTLFRNPRWLDLIISTSYALSSWAVQDSGYVPMWLSGSYMLPLLVLAAHYTRSANHSQRSRGKTVNQTCSSPQKFKDLLL